MKGKRKKEIEKGRKKEKLTYVEGVTVIVMRTGYDARRMLLGCCVLRMGRALPLSHRRVRTCSWGVGTGLGSDWLTAIVPSPRPCPGVLCPASPTPHLLSHCVDLRWKPARLHRTFHLGIHVFSTHMCARRP